MVWKGLLSRDETVTSDRGKMTSVSVRPPGVCFSLSCSAPSILSRRPGSLVSGHDVPQAFGVKEYNTLTTTRVPAHLNVL